jgi:hypothetical protein
MFVIVALETTFQALYGISYFQIPTSNSLFVMAIKTNPTGYFRTGAMLYYDILQENSQCKS